MSNLEEKHPDVYRKFLDGFHVVRRCNQCWAGLSSDLVIEQTLMRSLKSTGGLTRGKRGHAKPLDLICTFNIRVQQCDAGFHRPDLYYKSATQRLNWGVHQKRCIWSQENSDKACSLLTLHIWSYSEKHCQRDSGWARCECTWLWVGWEQDRWRYNRKVGIYLQIQAERQSPNLWEYLCCEDCSWSYHWSCPSVPAFPCGVKVRRSFPWIGFDVWTKPLPPALFETRNILRKSDKPQLAQTIRDHAADLSSEAVTNSIPKTDYYVLDGGSLLHRLPWKTHIMQLQTSLCDNTDKRQWCSMAMVKVPP